MPMYKRLLNLPSDIIRSIKIQCFPLLVIKIKIYYFILRKMRYERFVTALLIKYNGRYDNIALGFQMINFFP